MIAAPHDLAYAPELMELQDALLPPSPFAIIAAVEHKLRVNIRDRRRTNRIATARMIAMYLVRRITDLSYPKIARVMRRDHSTIIYACQRIEARMYALPEFRRTIEEMMMEIQGISKLEVVGRRYADADNLRG